MKFFNEKLRIISEIGGHLPAYERMQRNNSKKFEFKTLLYRVFSKHNIDIIVFSGLLIILIVFVVGLVLFFGKDLSVEKGRLQVILSATVLGAAVGIISKLFENAIKRLGTVDLFISEILSIGRVFTSGNVVGGLIFSYDQVEKIVVQYAPNPPPLKNFSTRYDEALRKENYLANFDRNSSDLGPFSADVVSNVTAFYTFLRASRDATGALSLWNNENYPIELRKNDIIVIVYYCLLLSIHGRQALENLVEKPRQLAYARGIFHTIELQAFLFLVLALPDGDPRLKPTRDRKPVYEKILRHTEDKNLADLLAITEIIKDRQ